MDFTFHHKGLAAMRHDYNRIAGQSIERLVALSDGIFAVAMTLLVLDLHAPAIAAIRGKADLLYECHPERLGADAATLFFPLEYLRR